MRNEAVSSPRTGKALLAVLTVALGALMLAAFASPAQAEVFKVTNKKNSGTGSLRNAVEKAAPRGDTIVFAPKVRGTITLTSGGIGIYKNLTIKGPGAGKLAINGNNYDTVFYIDGGKTVRMSGLTITEGSGYYGGGIENDGNLRLIESVVRDNFADYGGGIYNTNVLTLIESTVSANFADDEGGGINNYFGTLIVRRSTISGNRAEFGGGIDSDTELPSEGPLKTTIANSTISGNSISSASGVGGGIRNNNGLTRIMNSTITKNTAPEDQGGGVFSGRYTTTTVFSSIISENPPGGAVVFYGSTNTFTSTGYNVIGYGNATGAFNKAGDRRYVGDPGLGPLAANGGPTMTHALQSGSPAINGGSPNCPPPATDQRGVKRPQGGRCDTGSFEL